jgi:excisionase family DNA binding protein
MAGKMFCADNRFPYNFVVPKATHDYISTTEAGKILGISRQRVLKLVQEGRLKAIKVANVYLIKKRDLADVKDRKPGRPTKSKSLHK